MLNIENVLRASNLFNCFNPIQDGQEGPLPKICHICPTMMNLGSYTLHKEDPQNI